jgi:hypothetical protein
MPVKLRGGPWSRIVKPGRAPVLWKRRVGPAFCVTTRSDRPSRSKSATAAARASPQTVSPLSPAPRPPLHHRYGSPRSAVLSCFVGADRGNGQKWWNFRRHQNRPARPEPAPTGLAGREQLQSSTAIQMRWWQTRRPTRVGILEDPGPSTRFGLAAPNAARRKYVACRCGAANNTSAQRNGSSRRPQNRIPGVPT